MKKAFDQNVSRSKPKLKLGARSQDPAVPDAARGADEAWVYEVAAQVAGQQGVADVEAPTAREVLDAAAADPAARSRVEATLREAAAVAEPVQEQVTVAVGAHVRGAAHGSLPPGAAAVSGPARPGPGSSTVQTRGAMPPPGGRRAEGVPSRPVATAPAGVPERRAPGAPVRTETLATPPPPSRAAAAASSADDHAARRERLRERLRTVREHPRPEPLPTSVAAAGVLAVERIAQLQTELTAMKQHNAALQHDLDVTRRAAERATEEARGRVEEARRLVAQMEERAGLLSELERELQSVEGERDEALLAVQDARTQGAAEREERERLAGILATKDAELADSLSEEERLAGELERFRDESVQLRRSVEALTVERDTLARQVADLTAERAELLEARKALESVHRALTDAARR
ncbi:MAG TPA: extensin-like protein [Myxococcaceae bacterium]|nr:extensin-like protein [Myxococcaceae bacterium]